MIKNYIKIALRNIKRYSTYSILNITGMAIGMASAILILLWVQDEWSYDRHFKDAGNLYRVIEKQYFSGGEVFLVCNFSGLIIGCSEGRISRNNQICKIFKSPVSNSKRERIYRSKDCYNRYGVFKYV